MSSTKAKGKQNEKDVKNIFEKDDWKVEPPPKKVSWIPDSKKKDRRFPVVSDRDYFGSFDLICTRFDRPTTWVQVCVQILDRKKKVEKASQFINPNNRLMVWAKIGGRVRKHKSVKNKWVPAQFFNIYELERILVTEDGEEQKVEEGGTCYDILEELVLRWSPPSKVFIKSQLHNQCWICKTELVGGFCPDHREVGNQVVDL
jgi:hypothetical protein